MQYLCNTIEPIVEDEIMSEVSVEDIEVQMNLQDTDELIAAGY